ncbi:MAG: SDR family NAD(P)-dependent oxidoreductase, partial [Candidatus Ranarchaeia archaeon]
MYSLKGKIALVTGGSRGIGAAIAKYLAKQGADVIITYKNNRLKAQEVINEIKKYGRKCVALQLDLGDQSATASIADTTEACLGSVDILVNNAAVYIGKHTLEFTVEELNILFSVNLAGVFLCTKALLPSMMEKRWGRIINISSICAFTGC